MANGGWEFGTASGKLQGKIDWSSSSNGSSANTSNITAILYARRVDGYTTTGQSWSGYVKVQGKDNSNQTNISFDHSVSVGGSWVEMARVTLYNAKHNDDGSGSATVSGSVTGPSGTGLSGITSSGSSGITLDKIARYTNITNFSVDKRDETSFTFNWQTSDTIDYAWYSTNNGSNWTGVDVADGTSGSFAVTGLSIGGTYNCKLRVRRKDSQLPTDSGVVSKTTNSRPTSQVTGTSETTMSVKWTSDGTSNHIWYSLNNGSWVDVGNVNATTGTYTVSGLSPGTTYNVKTLVRKSNTSGQYESANASGKTYDYPYCTEAPNFTIGNSVTIKFHNPLNRSLQIQMYSHVANTFVTDMLSIGQVTQYTFTPDASRLYSSIPNNQSSKYNIDVWYNNNKAIGDKGTSYSINTSSIKPGFSNFAYKDVGTSALTAAIANDQVIVQGVSNVNLVISSANKMTPSMNASVCTSNNSKYVVTFDNLSKTQAYSDSDIDVNLGIPTGKGSKVFTVTAYDSRNIPNSIPKTIDIKPYSQPEVNPSLERLNGFETATTFSVAGTFSPVTVDNIDKNMISSIQYRYKESSSSTWGAWTAMSIDSQGSGVYQTTSITLQCDNEKQFDFQFEVTDLARTVTVSRTLSVGVPLMMLHTNGILDVQNGINSGKTDGSGSFKLNGNWDSQIYWKEYGYGDKFRIYPEFGGTDDSNKLRVQGSVGDAGTDPSLYDLMTISGKNGNLWLKGGAEVNGAISRNLGGSGTTISDTNIIDISGSTDGFQLKYKSTTADNGVTTMQTTDDSNSILSIGNEYSGAYHEALKILEGQVKMVKGSSWVQDRVNSIIRMTYVGNNGAYGPCICIGTKNGTWTLGCLSGEDSLTFNYVTDTNFINNNNTSSRYTLGTGGYFSGTCNGCNWSNYPSGFSGKSGGQGWGVQTGTFITGWDDSTGGSIAFRRDCPTGGQMSMVLDGSVYVQEGQCRCFGVKSLYDNSSGSTGTITLSESAANFTYLEIFYKEQAGKGGQNQDHNSVKVYSPNGAKFVLQLVEKSGSTDMRFCTSRGSISGTSIMRGNGAAFYLNGGRWEVEEINIYKVIGYK